MNDYPFVKARVILDSRNPFNAVRLITYELTYWRAIHAECMTHRQWARNAQSSRAIPAARRMQRVLENPVRPCRWGKNQKGMQPKDENLSTEETVEAEAAWRAAADQAWASAKELDRLGVHKQWVNRLLEPFDTITTIVTATEWDNFFCLRCHPTAQDEFQILAWKMADLYYRDSKPVTRRCHLPYVEPGELPDSSYEKAAMVSAARCARVSYLNHDGSAPDLDKDLTLAGRLLLDGHHSPFEHQAEATVGMSAVAGSGNLKGWEQHRKVLERQRPKPVFDYAAARAEYCPWRSDTVLA